MHLQNEEQREEYENRLKKVLDVGVLKELQVFQENPVIQYKNADIRFGQTTCVICLEEFSVEKEDK